MKTLREARIGLVIEGGGAKSAYTLGWLRELERRGVRFVGVSGTSAGGLNALIWATGEFEAGKRLWRRISFQTVYPFKRPYLLYFILAAANSLLTFLRNVFASEMQIENSFDAFKQSFYFLKLYLIAFLITVVLTGELFFLVHVVPIIVFVLLIPGLLWAFTVGFLHFTPPILDVLGATLMDNAPLRKSVLQVVSKRRFRCPTYLTLASIECIYGAEDFKNSPNFAANFPHASSDARARFQAKYHDVTKLPPCEVADAALASAALPYGIVPSVTIDDKSYVDGGVADKLPVHPIVSLKCDRILVLRLKGCSQQNGGDVQQFFRHHWRQVERVHLNALLPKTSIYFVKQQPIVEPPRWPQFVVVGPENHFGGLLAALKFQRQFTLKLERSGWRDARHMSEKWWDELLADVPDEPEPYVPNFRVV